VEAVLMNKKRLSERDICTKYITPALESRNYNLDCKNPHEVAVSHRDPEELMAEYQQIVSQLEAAQAALKAELMACLGGKT
jgi:type I restriction enzyme M protein